MLVSKENYVRSKAILSKLIYNDNMYLISKVESPYRLKDLLIKLKIDDHKIYALLRLIFVLRSANNTRNNKILQRTNLSIILPSIYCITNQAIIDN